MTKLVDDIEDLSEQLVNAGVRLDLSRVHTSNTVEDTLSNATS